jgi:hypothetical protein
MASQAETLQFAAAEIAGGVGDPTEQAWFTPNTLGSPTPLTADELAWRSLEEAITGLAQEAPRVNQ